MCVAGVIYSSKSKIWGTRVPSTSTELASKTLHVDAIKIWGTRVLTNYVNAPASDPFYPE